MYNHAGEKAKQKCGANIILLKFFVVFDGGLFAF